ncbi:MAG TPA: HdeA/HdeB family chaperone [Beijerinckiaceae bacterium]|jgi:acid stress chaperone HdeB
MRIAFALAFALPLLGAAPASAQKLDVATIKCDDFVKSGKETIGNLMMWLSGYYTGEDDDAVIDFDKMAADGQKLGAYCAQNPTISLLTAAERIMSKE